MILHECLSCLSGLPMLNSPKPLILESPLVDTNHTLLETSFDFCFKKPLTLLIANKFNYSPLKSKRNNFHHNCISFDIDISFSSHHSLIIVRKVLDQQLLKYSDLRLYGTDNHAMSKAS